MIENAIRSFLWGIIKLVLAMSEWVYEMLTTVVQIDFSNSKAIWYTSSFLLTFLSFAVSIRIIYLLAKKTANDEPIEYGKLGRRIMGAFVVVAVSVTFFSFFLGVPKAINDIYSRVIVYDTKISPSSSVISATAKTNVATDLASMNSTDEVIDIQTIDDKLNEKEEGQYRYFKGYSELILCGIAGFIIACLQLNLLTDVICRIFLNIFRFCIGFIPISSMIEDQGMCRDWVADLIADTLTISFTLIFTDLVFGLFASDLVAGLNSILKIVLLAVGFMAISKLGAEVAKYMGASNLSNGGHLGTSLLGMGAFGALRATSGLIKDGISGIASGANGLAGGMADSISDLGNPSNPAPSPLIDGQGYNPLDDTLGGGKGGVGPLVADSPSLLSTNPMNNQWDGSKEDFYNPSIDGSDPTKPTFSGDSKTLNSLSGQSSVGKNGVLPKGSAPKGQAQLPKPSFNDLRKTKGLSYAIGHSLGKGLINATYNGISHSDIPHFINDETSGSLYQSSSTIDPYMNTNSSISEESYYTMPDISTYDREIPNPTQSNTPMEKYDDVRDRYDE